MSVLIRLSGLGCGQGGGCRLSFPGSGALGNWKIPDLKSFSIERTLPCLEACHGMGYVGMFVHKHQ